MRLFTLVFCCTFAVLPCAAKEKPVKPASDFKKESPALTKPAAGVPKETAALIKPAPGSETVEANCAACHSLSYIEMNSPFLSDVQWDAEIKKMIKVMGAPIGEADAKTIADYLKKNYGG